MTERDPALQTWLAGVDTSATGVRAGHRGHADRVGHTEPKVTDNKATQSTDSAQAMQATEATEATQATEPKVADKKAAEAMRYTEGARGRPHGARSAG